MGTVPSRVDGRDEPPALRILIVNKFARITGGADQYCLRLTEHLRQRGHAVSWLSTRGTENLEWEGAFVDCTVTHSTRDRLPVRRRLRAGCSALWNRSAAAATGAMIDEFVPDVVHLHKLYPQLSVAPALVASRRGIPIVQTLHDYELISASSYDHQGHWYDAAESGLAYRLLNTVTFPVRRFAHAPRVDAHIAVSDYVAQIYAQHGIAATPVLNAVDPCSVELARPFDAREGIVFTGRLVAFKGVEDVLELAHRLPRIPVTIAGRGSMEAQVIQASRDLPNLTWRGWLPHPDVSRLLARARVAVMPSRWQEPAPLAALEAMACGTPVVTYANGGLGEAVERSGGGRVVAMHVGALVAASLELHEDHDAWSTASGAGVAATEGPYSVEGWVSGVEAVYRAVVKRP